MTQELVTLTIEGVEVQVPKRTTILEAAKQAGILIPHYCYHPGLPVAGVCRMCLVEVEGAPKLQIGCSAQAEEGQVVHVHSPEAKKAREGVLEFLLINHPLDCPICDQAGECELQDYVFEEGRARTRYTPTFAKRFSPVEDFGPDVVYVPNRCILCTRCVRFMDHVAEDPILNVSERGDRAFIGIHPGRGLDHPWSGNVVDLCPVGSLLSKDALHKARAWELDKTASVCTGCSQGCNVTVDTRDNVVVRLRPRSNHEVNRFFMCDHGRLHYRWMNGGDRIEAPLVAEGGELAATDWDHALARAAQLLEGVSGPLVAVASAGASSETLFLLKQIVDSREGRAIFRVERVPEEAELAGVPNLALREERAPNGAGARAFGYEDVDDLGEALVGAAAVIVLDEGLGAAAADVLQRAPVFLYLGTTFPEFARHADIVLPVTNVAEEDGTFVNRDGRVQRYQQAKAGPGMARPGWWVLAELRAEIGIGDRCADAAEVFRELAEHEGAFAGMSYAGLGFFGATISREVEVST